ncbi:hypothetical protein GOBAR_DD22088 [Gossypium barbadense]|nr:hypothetical protein GOBAR_DD22088 [Gossypium barbadense]
MDVSYPGTAYHQSVGGDGMEGMLRDAFNMHNHRSQSFPADFVASDDRTSVPHEEQNGEAAKFYALLNDMNKELEYKQILRSRSCSRITQHRDINKLFTKSFHEWLSQTVWSGKNVTDEVKWLSQDKMPRRKVRELSIVPSTPNSAETSSTGQQTAIGSSNVPVTPEEPTQLKVVGRGEFEDVRYLGIYTS